MQYQRSFFAWMILHFLHECKLCNTNNYLTKLYEDEANRIKRGAPG